MKKMLRIKILLFVQDVTDDSEKCTITDIYKRGFVQYFRSNPYETAKQCIMRNLREIVKKIYEGVDQTIETEAGEDLELFYHEDENFWKME
jgi:hypothetical protein